jgi:carboxymethylenebutenolidase
MNERTILGGVPGFLAKPAGQGPWPALLVIQEWWGLDAQTESIARRFADEGYLAFAPDLYHGDLAALGDHDAAMANMKKHGAQAPADLEAVFDALKASPDAAGPIGSVGFCFGGRMSLALGLRRPLDAVCTFYGGQMQTLFDKMDQWHIPVQGFFGDADPSIPQGTIEEFRAILARQGVDHEVIVYPASGHAFFRDSDPAVYKPGPSKDAWQKTLTFFGKYLRT